MRPALEVFGKVFVCGDRAGLAQSMKLANNFLSATGMAASSEAIAMGVKAGLDPKQMGLLLSAFFFRSAFIPVGVVKDPSAFLS